MSERTIKTNTASQNLASGALSHALTLTRDLLPDSGELLMVAIKFSAAVSQAISVTLQSVTGSDYAPVLDSTTTSSATTYIFRPSPAVPLKRGDVITVACANSGTPAAIAYSEIRYRETQ